MGRGVPNQSDFAQSDVERVLRLDPTSLSNCFANADDGAFDPLYKGEQDRLGNFRNYTPGGLETPSVTFDVSDGGTAFGDPVENASVANYVNNEPALKFDYTDHRGEVTYQLTVGDYNYAIFKATDPGTGYGFKSEVGDFTLEGQKTINVTLQRETNLYTFTLDLQFRAFEEEPLQEIPVPECTYHIEGSIYAIDENDVVIKVKEFSFSETVDDPEIYRIFDEDVILDEIPGTFKIFLGNLEIKNDNDEYFNVRMDFDELTDYFEGNTTLSRTYDIIFGEEGDPTPGSGGGFHPANKSDIIHGDPTGNWP